MKMEYLAKEIDGGKRVDFVLSSEFSEYTRSFFQKLFEEKKVFVNKKQAAKSLKLKENDFVEFEIPELRPLLALAEDIPLEIVYEDDDLLVVNKEKGMVVHPAAGNHEGTLVNALLSHCKGSLSGINGVIRPGIVHRIDKNTSGLLIVAKTNIAHIRLSEQIKTHSFKREYIALLNGTLKEDSGTVDLPIGRHPVDRKKYCVTDKNSKNAVTHYEVLERLPGYTLTKLILETGRTHQIRVHMASLGHSVAGDDVYGTKEDKKRKVGQYLHAKTIGFIHPTTGEYLEFSSEIPEDFRKVLEKLRRKV